MTLNNNYLEFLNYKKKINTYYIIIIIELLFKENDSEFIEILITWKNIKLNDNQLLIILYNKIYPEQFYIDSSLNFKNNFITIKNN